MAVTITENAAKQIKKQLTKRGKGVGLKLGVKKYGCSGYAYTLDYVDSVTEGDAVFGDFDVSVVVAADDLQFVDGIQLDYRKEGLNEAFKFDNPNVTGMCGCGQSFSVS